MQFGCANPGIKGTIAQEDPEIQCAQGKIECARRNLDCARTDIQCSGRQHACYRALYIESNAQHVGCAIQERKKHSLVISP